MPTKATNKIRLELYNGTAPVTFYPDSHKYKDETTGDWLVSVTGATDCLDKSKFLVPWAVNLSLDYLLEVKATGKVITLKDVEIARNLPTVRKEKAADVGTCIHEWAQLYAIAKRDNLPSPAIPEAKECGGESQHEKVISGILAFQDWFEQNDVRILETERMIFSKKHKYVGLMDLMFTMGTEGHKILHFGDYKTGGGIYSSMHYQVSGYKYAFLEELAFLRSVGAEYPRYLDLLEIGDDIIIRFSKEDKYKDGVLKEVAGTVEIKKIKPEDSEKNYACFLGLLTCKLREKELNSEYRNEHK